MELRAKPEIRDSEKTNFDAQNNENKGDMAEFVEFLYS